MPQWDDDLRQLSPQKAQQAVNSLIAGEPPGLDFVDLLSVGLEKDMRVFEQEYFCPTSFVVSSETKGSSFKIVEAYYGGGKSHYLRCIERTAHRNNFASAFVGLKKDECPLTRFDLIYSSVTESLNAPSVNMKPHARGIGEVIRGWVDRIMITAEEPLQELRKQVDSIDNLPLVGFKIALRIAAEAHAAGDEETFDEALVYLTSGKVPPILKKKGILQPVDIKNGSLALRTLASIVKKMGYAGFVLIFDEGDRSLSLGSAREKKAASNNLVQLINETAGSELWPSTMLLYSIPSWHSFSDAFADNQALIQRTEFTGFPSVPPAPRIVLDNRESTDDKKMEFCIELAKRLQVLFDVARPNMLTRNSDLAKAPDLIAQEVLDSEVTSTYRRLFVQSYLSALYRVSAGDTLDETVAREIVSERNNQLSSEG